MPRIKTTLTVSEATIDGLDYRSLVLGSPYATTISRHLECNLKPLNSRERVELLQARRKLKRK